MEFGGLARGSIVLAYGPNDREKRFRGKNLEFGGFRVIGVMFKVVCVKI